MALSIVALVSCEAQEKQFSPAALNEKLVSLEGDNTNLSTILKRHQGKTVVIEVWASWCGDCVKAMPLLKQLQSDHKNVDYVFISMDKTADSWKAGIDKHKLEGAHYWATDGMKGAFGKAADIDWIPRYIIVDKTGKVVLYRAIEKDFEKINAILKEQSKK